MQSQKIGHVTFFWNGNRGGKFDKDLETYQEVCVQAASLMLRSAHFCAINEHRNVADMSSIMWQHDALPSCCAAQKQVRDDGRASNRQLTVGRVTPVDPVGPQHQLRQETGNEISRNRGSRGGGIEERQIQPGTCLQRIIYILRSR